MVRQLNNPSHVGAQSCAHALPCECIETAVSPDHISFLFVYFTGALPPYPYELFEKKLGQKLLFFGGGTMGIPKTNAMRILEKEKISYEMHTYDASDGHIDGAAVARKV